MKYRFSVLRWEKRVNVSKVWENGFCGKSREEVCESDDIDEVREWVKCRINMCSSGMMWEDGEVVRMFYRGVGEKVVWEEWRREKWLF